MSKAKQDPPDGFEELSMPEWHREILMERLAEHDAEPDAGRPWEQVEADLRRRVASRR